MNHRGYSDQQKNSKKVLWALIVMFFCFVALPVILIISIRDAEALRCHLGTDPVAIDLCHAEWEREWQEHARQHEQWEHERREHERQRERERKQDQERKEVERKRKEEERRKEQERRDEEERQRLALFWTVPFPAEHCHSYGTREYTAHLQNLPMFYSNRMKACMSTSASLHDVTITPNFCVDHGFWGGVSGHFKVNFSEPTCTPSWGDFSINECAGVSSGLRYVESRLWNINRGENWQLMCSTTPADILGRYFPTPKSCNDRGLWGMYGIWEIEDRTC